MGKGDWPGCSAFRCSLFRTTCDSRRYLLASNFQPGTKGTLCELVHNIRRRTQPVYAGPGTTWATDFQRGGGANHRSSWLTSDKGVTATQVCEAISYNTPFNTTHGRVHSMAGKINVRGEVKKEGLC